jgi:hypothetical protein
MLIMCHHMKYCMLCYDRLSFTVMTLNRFMYWYVIAVLIDVNATATWILLDHQWHNSAEFHENVTVTEKETYANTVMQCASVHIMVFGNHLASEMTKTVSTWHYFLLWQCSTFLYVQKACCRQVWCWKCQDVDLPVCCHILFTAFTQI